VSVIPCKQNASLNTLVDEFAEVLKTEAHQLGTHGLTEEQFYESGIFRGAIERIRGQFSAEMSGKREFVRDILNYMQDREFITNWESAGSENRHDYMVKLPTGRVSVIELKGCLDGNNTNIFERPAHAQEFVIWSICQNAAADPRRNVWSGIHTRLSAEVIEREQCVDGIIVWDMVCGTVGRPCPKLEEDPGRVTMVAHYSVPPPCLYVLPGTIPSTRNNPKPVAQALDDVQLLKAFHQCFGGRDEEVNFVDFEVEHRGADTVRKTTVRRNEAVAKNSKLTPIRRA
jgi:hypothetical protein